MGWTCIYLLQLQTSRMFSIFVPCFFSSLLLVGVLSSGQVAAQAQSCNGTSGFSSILVFGDSTADTGNNNYIDTYAKANFPPYGRDFPNHVPTGRFSNGRIGVDFIAQGIGLKDTVPAYLNKSVTIQDLLTGVSFASANMGLDSLTSELSRVISLDRQFQYFKEYKSRIQAAIGNEMAENLIRNALFFVSAGSNDFLANYFMFPFREMRYNIPEFQSLLIGITKSFLQKLVGEGASRIAVVGLSPLGMLPTVKGMAASATPPEQQSLVASEFNAQLAAMLGNFSASNINPAIRTVFIDTYSTLSDIVTNPSKYGLEYTGTGCCGEGLLVTGFLCNKQVPICSDASKYVFWDSVHPTEIVYKIESDVMLQRDIPRLLAS